jgi:hypothetical protein
MKLVLSPSIRARILQSKALPLLVFPYRSRLVFRHWLGTVKSQFCGSLEVKNLRTSHMT